MNRKSKAAAWYRNFAQREGFEGGNKPKAILIISAHWEAQPVRILSPKTPIPLLYDYYGFPKHTYELKYEARGDAHVASRVSQLLSSAGIKNKEETSRGYDHGVFIPLMLMFPQADIPVIQLSLDSDLDPAVHLSIGKALQPLRDEGVLIIGSGFITHDLSFRLSDKQAIEFVDSVTNVMQLSGAERDQQLSQVHHLHYFSLCSVVFILIAIVLSGTSCLTVALLTRVKSI
jgi:aromatic ring-opening dioxygenase catalytic subunit (LigB family)